MSKCMRAFAATHALIAMRGCQALSRREAPTCLGLSRWVFQQVSTGRAKTILSWGDPRCSLSVRCVVDPVLRWGPKKHESP